MKINLAPYSVQRYFDGTEIFWLIKKEDDPRCAVSHYNTREEAEAERNRLNSNYALNAIGV
jgi:hypothetical protein|tara:strand:+ start:568 stop:750 length:183 start_codon:yes stop_codon:yes gene_type:complete